MRHTLTFAFIVSLVSGVHGQSLADAARKAAEKRGATPAASSGETKVYTRKDIEALPPEVVTAPPAVPAAKEPTPPAPEPVAGAGPAKDEAYWKKRMAPLRADLDRLLPALSAARANLRNVEGRMFATPAYWGMYGLELGRLKDEVSSWEAAVRDAEKRIANLEEEGRVAGALPGWLR